MPTNLNLEDILRKNPQVNPDELRRIQQLFAELQSMGAGKPVKRLADPFERRRVRPVSDIDSKTVKLRSY
jgi:hypothetical protein